MTRCKLCGEKITKNSEFILEGKFPGLAKRLFNWNYSNRLDYYGDCYHRRCYIDVIGGRYVRPSA